MEIFSNVFHFGFHERVVAEGLVKFFELFDVKGGEVEGVFVLRGWLWEGER